MAFSYVTAEMAEHDSHINKAVAAYLAFIALFSVRYQAVMATIESHPLWQLLVPQGHSRAQMTTKRMIQVGVGIVVSLLIVSVLAGELLPVAISAFNDANTTGWGSTETTLFGLMPIFVVLLLLGVFIAWLIGIL